MGFFRRLAFYWGFVLGLATLAIVGIVALTYLFTGKFPTPNVAEGKTEMQLLMPGEVVALVREQVEKAKAAQEAGVTGGENDGQE
jgi:hypothetical protein